MIKFSDWNSFTMYFYSRPSIPISSLFLPFPAAKIFTCDLLLKVNALRVSEKISIPAGSIFSEKTLISLALLSFLQRKKAKRRDDGNGISKKNTSNECFN